MERLLPLNPPAHRTSSLQEEARNALSKKAFERTEENRAKVLGVATRKGPKSEAEGLGTGAEGKAMPKEP